MLEHKEWREKKGMRTKLEIYKLTKLQGQKDLREAEYKHPH